MIARPDCPGFAHQGRPAGRKIEALSVVDLRARSVYVSRREVWDESPAPRVMITVDRRLFGEGRLQRAPDEATGARHATT